MREGEAAFALRSARNNDLKGARRTGAGVFKLDDQVGGVVALQAESLVFLPCAFLPFVTLDPIAAQADGFPATLELEVDRDRVLGVALQEEVGLALLQLDLPAVDLDVFEGVGIVLNLEDGRDRLDFAAGPVLEGDSRLAGLQWLHPPAVGSEALLLANLEDARLAGRDGKRLRVRRQVVGDDRASARTDPEILLQLSVPP